MSFFVYRPHVYGDSGITSPDLLVDCAATNKAWIGMHNVSSSIQFSAQALTGCRAAVVLCAAGGGTLLAPALAYGEAGVSVARKAWRWADVLESLPTLVLNAEPLSPLFERADELAFAGFDQGNLPRGHMLVLQGNAVSTTSGGLMQVSLDNTATTQSVKHTVSVAGGNNTNVAPGDSAIPSRYAIGPTKQTVTHYNIIEPD